MDAGMGFSVGILDPAGCAAPVGPYSVILADPPWQYKNWTAAKNGAQQAHYNGMTVEDIGSLGAPVRKWADPRACVLFLWATWPKLNEAFSVIDAWGWRYVTGLPWIKTTPSNGTIRRGTGFWVMGASEILLIAVRGKNPRRVRDNPVIGLLTGETPVFYHPRFEHSKKPEDVQAWIDRMLPDGRRLELFARRRRAGWDCAGLDTGYRLTERGAEPYTPPQAPDDPQMDMFTQ